MQQSSRKMLFSTSTPNLTEPPTESRASYEGGGQHPWAVGKSSG